MRTACRSNIPTGSDFQPLKPLQVTSFTPSYDKDRYSNTAWTVNGKLGDLNAVYTGGYTDRDIHRADGLRQLFPLGRRHVLPVRRRLDGLRHRRGAAAIRRSATGRTRSTARISATSFASARRTIGALRAIGGAYWEEFRIYDDMNFNYKTIPSCVRPS